MSILAPASANALGVGEIKLHSALNQNLNAEIPLITASSEALSDIHVKLASPGAFVRAGIERHFLLSHLHFKPVQKADGSIVVKVTSHEVIREPFLNFLLEVNWPQGQMLKEFTVLLDPPITFQQVAWNAQEAPTTSPIKPPAAFDRLDEDGAHEPNAKSWSPGSEYGPVKRNDSLWAIAERLNQDDSISTEQMIVALYKNNPRAFYEDNINALKVGQLLKIPAREMILNLSPQEALQEFQRQWGLWTGRLSSREKTERQGKEQTAAKDQPEPQLKLLALAEGDEAAAAVEGEVEEKAELAMEIAQTVSQENENLRARLAELERQMATMQRLVALKDEQLAALQSAQKAIDKAEEGTQTPQKQAAIPPTEAAKPVTKPASQKVEETEAGDSLLSALLAEPFYLTTAGGSLLAIALLAGLIVRRRKAASNEEESALTAVSDQPAPDTKASVDEEKAESLNPIAESSFLSEFTPSDFAALETESDEVDPVAEADVYLAYGRYQQAEDLIRHAIEAHPERGEYKLKLLEIYHATENKEAFESYANELRAASPVGEAQVKDSYSDFWKKIKEMGRELCPENALFSEAQVSSVETDLEEPSAQNEPFEFEFSWEKSEADGKETLESSERKALELTETLPLETVESAPESADLLSKPEAEEEFELLTEWEEPQQDEREEFEFELELISQGAETDSADEDEQFAHLTEMDEMETKLDLAKAYVDMDDADSARDILDEILGNGSEKQKETARALANKMGVI